jgi:DNA-binding transcriptional LysR family regulator
MRNKLKIRHLEAVIALAEEMNYTRAAKRIGLTQSGMSRCIQSAEREAKATLFARNTFRVELTDSGRLYYEHARISLAHGERAVRSAVEAREGAETLLRIGKSPDVDPVLIEILYAIRLPLFPGLRITLHSESSNDLAHSLLTADLDLALITQPGRNAKLTMHKLVETPLYVVLPTNHRASHVASVKLSDLQEDRWIIFHPRMHPLLYDKIMRRTEEAGFHPKALNHILYPDEAGPQLLANSSIAFLTRANALKFNTDRLVAKPLQDDSLCLDEWIAARADNGSRLVSEFVRAYGTHSKAVLQPSQLTLAMGGEAAGYTQCLSN